MRKQYLGLAAILALVLLNQGIFTADAVSNIRGRYPADTLLHCAKLGRIYAQP